MGDIKAFDGGKGCTAKAARVKVWVPGGSSTWRLAWDRKTADIDTCFVSQIEDSPVLTVYAGDESFTYSAAMAAYVEILEDTDEQV